VSSARLLAQLEKREGEKKGKAFGCGHYCLSNLLTRSLADGRLRSSGSQHIWINDLCPWMIFLLRVGICGRSPFKTAIKIVGEGIPSYGFFPDRTYQRHVRHEVMQQSRFTNMEHETPKRVDITGFCGIKHVLRIVCSLDQCGICKMHATTYARFQV